MTSSTCESILDAWEKKQWIQEKAICCLLKMQLPRNNITATINPKTPISRSLGVAAEAPPSVNTNPLYS